jgi:hypothetical protein
MPLLAIDAETWRSFLFAHRPAQQLIDIFLKYAGMELPMPIEKSFEVKSICKNERNNALKSLKSGHFRKIHPSFLQCF